MENRMKKRSHIGEAISMGDEVSEKKKGIKSAGKRLMEVCVSSETLQSIKTCELIEHISSTKLADNASLFAFLINCRLPCPFRLE